MDKKKLLIVLILVVGLVGIYVTGSFLYAILATLGGLVAYILSKKNILVGAVGGLLGILTAYFVDYLTSTILFKLFGGTMVVTVIFGAIIIFLLAFLLVKIKDVLPW